MTPQQVVSSYKPSKRRALLFVVGVIAAGAAFVMLDLTVLRRVFGIDLTSPNPAKVCKAIAAKSFRNMRCYHQGGEVYGWTDLDDSFTVTGPGWELYGAVSRYDGSPLEGLACMDHGRRMVMGFSQANDGPLTGEPGGAARELCAILAKR